MRAILKIILVWLPVIAWAQSPTPGLVVQGSIGVPYTFPARLSFRQAGLHDFSHQARFAAEPFVPPWYWDAYAAWRGPQGEYGARLTHHKVLLVNFTPDVPRFQVTHGFNMLSVFARKDLKWAEVIVGTGVIIGHPETRIRGLENTRVGIFDGGYFVTGPAFDVGLGRRYFVAPWFFLHAEARTSWSYVRFPIGGGDVRFQALSAHLKVGTGFFLHP
ncbi:MAG: hypothetical protein OEY56_05460 [Cyclobacteriaceae bacterium]|nr:hypothetical protein [Cyclobacteriaceae bacterium]